MNSFGRIFRVSIFGESHGIQIGAVVDGCPAGIPLHENDLKEDFARRRAGGIGTTPRVEPDLPRIVSGVFNGKTTGAPITIVFENTNTKSGDYSNLWDHPRPGHADFTGQQKYGAHNDPRGGGHFSGRITLGIVAAGVIAKKIISPTIVSATLIEAVQNGTVKPDSLIMLNITGGGEKRFKAEKEMFYLNPDLVFDISPDEKEVEQKVRKLF